MVGELAAIAPYMPASASENKAAESKHVGLAGSVAILAAVALPSVLLVSCFSAVGVGLDIYNAVAPGYMNMLGNGVGALFALWLCILFIFDVQRLPLCLRLVLGTLAVVLLLAAAVLKGVFYPWAVMCFTLFMVPAGLAVLRHGICKETRKSEFYRAVGIVALCCAATVCLVWALWMLQWDNRWSDETKLRLVKKSSRIYEHVYSPMPLDYTFHCQLDQLGGFTPAEKTKIKTACSTAQTVWFMTWMAPFIAILCNLVISVFCIVVSMYASGDDHNSLERILRNSVCILAFLCAGIYCSVYASGASVQLASALLGFFSAGMVGVFIWVYREVDLAVLQNFADNSKLIFWLRKAWQSDWFRAMAISSVGFFGLPLCLCLYILRQRVRRLRGTAGDGEGDADGLFSAPSGKRIQAELNTWNWSGIFIKVNILWEIFFVLNIGMKLAYVSFSMLDELLRPVEFIIVLALVFFVGLGMFMLPPVPGSSVYMFAGIVIGRKAQAPGQIGFWAGAAVASLLGLVAKLSACLGQYMIGYIAGKSVKVQKTIGVDTVPTRAVENILSQSGLKIGKVAILVGGPDWPTSVTCGILRLNIPQMLLGTLPVFVASIAPQTIMGALLTVDSTDSVWSMLSAGATGIAAICQAAATLTAAYSITQTIERDGKTLAKYRAEHAEVADLTQKQKAMSEARKNVSSWKSLTTAHKAVLLASVALQLFAGFVFASDFVLSENLCFNDFAINSSVGDSFEEGGLKGDVLNLVIRPPQGPPIGWGVIGIFFLAVLLHCYLVSSWGRAARHSVKQVKPGEVDE